MSVPFSFMHLRVPQGFGPILEGLAREVLRDQPEDIPKYAAEYFDALLKQREDSGMDPAEWAAKQEDTYNNNALKAAGAIPEKDPETEVTISKEKSLDEADDENPEDETDQNEHNEKVREGEFHQNSEEETKSNNPDDKEDETTDTVGRDNGDIHAEGYSEVEDHSPQVTWSNVSTAATESETLEASAQLPLEENEPEDAVVEKERSSEAEDLVEEGQIDSEIQKKSDAMCEEGSIILTESADRPAASHQGEERPLGKDSTEPEGKSGDKDECSRPQEEEDIMDIPLDDPEANRAAAKIQAGFRGHMTRKKMKPEDKAEAEEIHPQPYSLWLCTGVSNLDDKRGTHCLTAPRLFLFLETGGSGALERDDKSVPER
ncbi:hypothetical protein VZT92_020703 [Zoarces viviparus]|uniref:RIIa domain-containing protein n=1 Tax=Zoarces viviparus TaxID=48416 RepID=A0AAW1EE88_ZOAVI